MEAAFVFGNLGNAVTALDQGWSVEDAFAWAVDQESLLNLPLPGGDDAYVLRIDIHPAIFRGAVDAQRLTVTSEDSVLGTFTLSQRAIIEIALPQALTRGRKAVTLRLRHPDAARPSDHTDSNDRRLLALCFHSATLAVSGSSAGRPGEAAMEPVHGLIAGDGVARRIAEIIGKLPCLSGRMGIRYLPFGRPLNDALALMPSGTTETASFCWLEESAGTPAIRDPLRARLPPSCRIATFHTPVSRALWPFLAQDPRAVAEPGLYGPARYTFGDRLALPLAAMNMPDDVVYLMYEMSAESDPVDLRALFHADLERWRAQEAGDGIRLADYIEGRIHTERVFISPSLPGPALLREMVTQVLAHPAVRDAVPMAQCSMELGRLLDGFVGWQEELPVYKRVANHFGLSWWSADLKYCWMNNYRTYREYILDYIRWVQWRT